MSVALGGVGVFGAAAVGAVGGAVGVVSGVVGVMVTSLEGNSRGELVDERGVGVLCEGGTGVICEGGEEEGLGGDELISMGSAAGSELSTFVISTESSNDRGHPVPCLIDSLGRGTPPCVVSTTDNSPKVALGRGWG